MKFYHYSHCPFCQRVRLFLGAKRLPFESIVLSYADFETPESLIGKKMLPIIQFDDGTIMAESLDLIYEIENRFPEHKLIIDDTYANIQWAATKMLNIPRYFDLLLSWMLDGYKDAPEMDEAGAKYFRESKEQKRGVSFEDLKSESISIFENNVAPVLQEVEERIADTGFVGASFGAADCVLVSDMSSLRLVPEIALSEEIMDYFERVESFCGDQLLKY